MGDCLLFVGKAVEAGNAVTIAFCISIVVYIGSNFRSWSIMHNKNCTGYPKAFTEHYGTHKPESLEDWQGNWLGWNLVQLLGGYKEKGSCVNRNQYVIWKMYQISSQKRRRKWEIAENWSDSKSSEIGHWWRLFSRMSESPVDSKTLRRKIK